MMRKMLHQVKNIKHYVNDVQVHRALWTEHLATLQELFMHQDQEGGVDHTPSKCCLGYSSLYFVCHTVGSYRIVMEEDTLDRIQDVPAPETKK